MATLTQAGKDSLDNLVVCDTIASLWCIDFHCSILFQAQVVQGQTIPGFVFGATSVDQELYFKGGGYNVVNNPQSGEVNEDSLFWICSQGKLIVHVSPYGSIPHQQR